MTTRKWLPSWSLLSLFSLGLFSFSFLLFGGFQLVSKVEPNECGAFPHRPNYDLVFAEGPYKLYFHREGILNRNAPSNSSNDGQIIKTMSKEKRRGGLPVLFIHGHAGGFGQIKSIAARTFAFQQQRLKYLARRAAKKMKPEDEETEEEAFFFEFFTIDFNEEFSAFHGHLIEEQAHFGLHCLDFISNLYAETEPSSSSTRVLLIGHSMGGIVARVMLSLSDYVHANVHTLITLGTPHSRSPWSGDHSLEQLYKETNQFWQSRHPKVSNVTVLSISGGRRDYFIRPELSSLFSSSSSMTEGIVSPSRGLTVFTTSIPDVWVQVDHKCLLWCQQLVDVLVRSMYDLVEPETGRFREDPEERMSIFRNHFTTSSPTKLVSIEPKSILPAMIEEKEELVVVTPAEQFTQHHFNLQAMLIDRGNDAFLLLTNDPTDTLVSLNLIPTQPSPSSLKSPLSSSSYSAFSSYERGRKFPPHWTSESTPRLALLLTKDTLRKFDFLEVTVKGSKNGPKFQFPLMVLMQFFKTNDSFLSRDWFGSNPLFFSEKRFPLSPIHPAILTIEDETMGSAFYKQLVYSLKSSLHCPPSHNGGSPLFLPYLHMVSSFESDSAEVIHVTNFSSVSTILHEIPLAASPSLHFFADPFCNFELSASLDFATTISQFTRYDFLTVTLSLTVSSFFLLLDFSVSLFSSFRRVFPLQLLCATSLSLLLNFSKEGRDTVGGWVSHSQGTSEQLFWLYPLLMSVLAQGILVIVATSVFILQLVLRKLSYWIPSFFALQSNSRSSLIFTFAVLFSLFMPYFALLVGLLFLFLPSSSSSFHSEKVNLKEKEKEEEEEEEKKKKEEADGNERKEKVKKESDRGEELLINYRHTLGTMTVLVIMTKWSDLAVMILVPRLMFQGSFLCDGIFVFFLFLFLWKRANGPLSAVTGEYSWYLRWTFKGCGVLLLFFSFEAIYRVLWVVSLCCLFLLLFFSFSTPGPPITNKKSS